VGAWRLLRPDALRPARDASPELGFGRVLSLSYYVDAWYRAVIVRPLVWFSEKVLWKVVDATLVDGIAVNGVARFSRFLGWLGSRLQTGTLGAYVFMFMVGVLVVILGVKGSSP
jgi:NADH-quinone oxidoreductase subunit L